MVNIGAVLRVTPIKDVKTLIQAFAFAKEQKPRIKLWIMGPWEEDMDYAQECFDLVEILKIPDVMFTGRINVMEYLGRMDLTILTSISEGQPLTILESYAAKKPVIATDVGNCRGLIYGEGDDFGPAGILTHIMNVEEIALAMVQMAESGTMRVQMGINGYNRLMSKYRIEHMQKLYYNIYQQFENSLDSGRLTFAPLATDDQYTEDAELTPDNNLSENAIRPFAIGRKNWLFFNCPEGAESGCLIYSLIVTASLNGLNPLVYLTEIIEKAPITTDWSTLLPWNIESMTG
jgi:hypothetical protein